MSAILNRLRSRRANPAADDAGTGTQVSPAALHLPRTRMGAWLGRPMTSFHLIIAVTALLIMLGLTILLAAFFVAYVVYLQSSVLLETRRHNKEMQTQRDLADKAEASRFTELRNFLETQENTHMARNAERHSALLARVEQLEAAVRQRADQTDNTVAAHIGQLEDRLDRRGTSAPVGTVEAGPGTTIIPPAPGY